MNRLYPIKRNSFFLYSEYLGAYSVKKSVSIFIGMNPVCAGPDNTPPARSLHTDYWITRVD